MIVSELKQNVELFMEEIFRDYEHTLVKNAKAIHDSVLETNYFLPYEIAFLDLPIVQRLRHISQTDVASYVFPSGNHNRLEHTLGVATIAGKFVDALYRRNSSVLMETNISKEFAYQHCRVAAILHDVGHGPFSHLSEQVYAAHFKEIKKEPRFLGASPHEILSYLITTSERMQRFNTEIIKDKYGIEIDLQLVGDIIVGFSVDKPDKVFMVEIINGAFDADKLDYMLRDSHSTGIPMSLDLSRLLYSLDVIKHEDRTRLSTDIGGVIALEQIVFNKMTLFTTIYHHHKVRATGCLLKSVFINNEEFQSPTDYLKYTDDDIWSFKSAAEKTVILQNLKKRKIPKRALVISARTIGMGLENLRDIMNLAEGSIEPTNGIAGEDYIDAITTTIAERVLEKYNLDIRDQIWIDIPNAPRFKEAITCVIKNYSTTTPYLTLSNVFPIDEWVKAFSQNKWNAFVFTMPEYCKEVSEVSKMVFEELFNIKFNEYALSICKISEA